MCSLWALKPSVLSREHSVAHLDGGYSKFEEEIAYVLWVLPRIHSSLVMYTGPSLWKFFFWYSTENYSFLKLLPSLFLLVIIYLVICFSFLLWLPGSLDSSLLSALDNTDFICTNKHSAFPQDFLVHSVSSNYSFRDFRDNFYERSSIERKKNRKEESIGKRERELFFFLMLGK